MTVQKILESHYILFAHRKNLEINLQYKSDETTQHEHMGKYITINSEERDSWKIADFINKGIEELVMICFLLILFESQKLMKYFHIYKDKRLSVLICYSNEESNKISHQNLCNLK